MTVETESTFDSADGVWQGFWNWTATRPTSRYVFRGQSQNYSIVPKIGRDTYDYHASIERRMFRKFRASARPYLGFDPRSDWDWLALAQHHGAPTRLTDWSESPLVALYFALDGAKTSADPIIYALDLYRDDIQTVDGMNLDTATGKFRLSNGMALSSPFELSEGIVAVDTNVVTPRISSQRGMFTVHGNPTKPLEVPPHQQFTIPAEFARDLFGQLMELGVDALHIFPDINGLCKSLDARYDAGLSFSALG